MMKIILTNEELAAAVRIHVERELLGDVGWQAGVVELMDPETDEGFDDYQVVVNVQKSTD